MYDHPPSAGGETKLPQHSKWGHRSGLGPGADHQSAATTRTGDPSWASST